MMLWSLACIFGTAAVAVLVAFYARRRLLNEVENLVEVFRAAHATRDTKTLEDLSKEKSLGQLRSRLRAFIIDHDERLREREDALNDVEELSRLKSELIANVSHELRTPLNAIMNIPVFLERAYARETNWRCPDCCGTQGDPGNTRCTACGARLQTVETTVFRGDAEEHLRFVRMFGDSSRHMLQVLDDLLNFSKLAAGKARLNLHSVDALQLCARLRPSMDFVATQKDVTISWPLRGEPLQFTADPVRVSQVLLNLLSNAIKFTQAGGNVRVEVTQVSEPFPGISFRVADDGVGIPTEELPKIFDSFRQVDNQEHVGAGVGVGLGLAISRQLAELHGGRLWADSEPGKGSVFSLLIPLTPPRAPSVEDVAQAVPVISPEPVVVVEDDAVQLAICRHMLERLGFTVDVVTDATQAVQRITTLKPQFVVLDIMLPNVSGLTILERLKATAATRDIPVMVTTSYHGHKELVRSLGGLWLPKPWSARDLSAALLRWQLVAQVPAEKRISP